MTRDEAAELVIEGMNYAAYREEGVSLYDSDKNRLFGSEHYNSGRIIVRPTPWDQGNVEEKMTTLLVWANWLNHSAPRFAEAQKILVDEDSPLGEVIRKARRQFWRTRLRTWLRRLRVTR